MPVAKVLLAVVDEHLMLDLLPQRKPSPILNIL